MKILQRLALSSALFALALTGGCGGGSGTSPVVPTTIPGTALRNSAFRPDNGQVGLFSLTRNGNAVAGTLRILDAVTSQLKAPTGDYPISSISRIRIRSA